MAARYVIRGTLLFDNYENKKMYPVGRWETYSHMFYNYDDICYNEFVESGYGDEEYEKFEEAQRLLEAFEGNPRVNGMVYAVYEDYKKMKDVIGAYVFRHGGIV